MNDLISRREVTAILDKYRVPDSVYHEINKLPEFSSDREKGEWIFYDEEFYQQGRFANVTHRIRECSICHHKIADFVGNMDFCPNCGADMRGKAE